MAEMKYTVETVAFGRESIIQSAEVFQKRIAGRQRSFQMAEFRYPTCSSISRVR